MKKQEGIVSGSMWDRDFKAYHSVVFQFHYMGSQLQKAGYWYKVNGGQEYKPAPQTWEEN